MRTPPPRAHLPAAERRTVSRIHQLLASPGLLHGSLHTVRRLCGKSGCHCARGEGHPSLRLQLMQPGGRQVALHVPTAWEGRVREWIDRDREIRRLLLEISASYGSRLRERRE